MPVTWAAGWLAGRPFSPGGGSGVSIITSIVFWLSDAVAIVMVAIGIIGMVVLIAYALYRIGRLMLLGRARNDVPYYDEEDYP